MAQKKPLQFHAHRRMKKRLSRKYTNLTWNDHPFLKIFLLGAFQNDREGLSEQSFQIEKSEKTNQEK
jgi:NADH:ubiquinone oxidoreductase subunit C